jgi:predicted methyltransferase
MIKIILLSREFYSFLYYCCAGTTLIHLVIERAQEYKEKELNKETAQQMHRERYSH